MGPKPIVGGRYLVRWKEELGSPRIKGDVKIPSFGVVMLDDADIHYGTTTPNAAYYVRPSKALGSGYWVVVSRVHAA